MKPLKALLTGLLVLGILSGCADMVSTPGEAEAGEPELTSEDSHQDDSPPTPDDTPSQADAAEPFAHAAVLELDLAGGTLTAEFSYTRDDKLGEVFLLNRDFTVTALICDGGEIDPADVVSTISLEGRYPVNRYALPRFEKSLLIRYTGALTGSPRLTTYSLESISEAFTMLRWETFCYPLFGEELYGLYDYMDLDDPLRGSVTVRVPEGYTVATPYPLLEQESADGMTAWVFDGDLAGFSAAIAPYEMLELPSGTYYFLPGTDLAAMEALISPVMQRTQQFMSETFGAVEIPGSMRYIAIPEGYGGWAINGKAVFLDESAFDSEHDLLQLAHEYIHLGWNPKTDTANRPVGRSRFFDEGYTMYFQARVAGELWGEEAYQAEIDRLTQRFSALLTQRSYSLVPIAEYGQHEYGDLSYAAGPIFFDRLAKLVGTGELDAATGAFLARYRDTPVDFELFAQAYLELLDHPELEQFLGDWLYSTAGIEQVLSA